MYAKAIITKLTHSRMMWSAGVVAALGSITYPAISAFVSLYASPESQGEYIMCTTIQLKCKSFTV